MKNLLICVIVLVFSVTQAGCIAFSVVHGRYKMPTPPVMDKDQVLIERGAPARTYHNNGREYWVYPTKKQWAWRGIAFTVILTLPLIIPVGSEATVLGFEGERLVSIKTDSTISKTYGCYGVDGMICGLGWDSDFRTGESLDPRYSYRD